MRRLALTVAGAAALLSGDSLTNHATAMMFTSPASMQAVIDSNEVGHRHAGVGWGTGSLPASTAARASSALVRAYTLLCRARCADLQGVYCLPVLSC